MYGWLWIVLQVVHTVLYLKLFVALNAKTNNMHAPKRRSWPYFYMKARDETFSKPKLSHPKETRNREGSHSDSGERKQKLFCRFMRKWELRGGGGIETHTCWVEVNSIVWDSCVSKTGVLNFAKMLSVLLHNHCNWPLISMWRSRGLQKWMLLKAKIKLLAHMVFFMHILSQPHCP